MAAQVRIPSHLKKRCNINGLVVAEGEGFEPSMHFSIISCKPMNSLMESKQLKRPESINLMPATSSLSRHPTFDRKSRLKAVIVAAVLDQENSDVRRFFNSAHCRQHFLYFFSDPQGHGSFRPTFRYRLVMVFITWIGCRLANSTFFSFCRNSS